MNVFHLLGWRVKQWRLANGLTQEEFAGRVGSVTQGFISELENGKANPELQTIYAISLAMNSTVAELFAIEGGPEAILSGKLSTKRPHEIE